MGNERKHRSSGRDEVVADDNVASDVDSAAARKEQVDADVDAILDEIDDVLEENAAEFVSSFVQKGGE